MANSVVVINVVKMAGFVVVVNVKDDGFSGFGRCGKNDWLSEFGQCGQSCGFWSM